MTGLGIRHEAFMRYVRPEIDALYRVARTLVEQPADAEDLVQDTLVRAYRSIEGFDGRHPRAWLLTILRNAERNRHRKMRPRLLHDDPGPTFDRLADPQGMSHDPAYIVVESDFNAEVERAFREMPARYRMVVALVDIEGFSYIEAAQALDVPKGTVMSRLHRARKRIRDQLEGESVHHMQRGGR